MIGRQLQVHELQQQALAVGKGGDGLGFFRLRQVEVGLGGDQVGVLLDGRGRTAHGRIMDDYFVGGDECQAEVPQRLGGNNRCGRFGRGGYQGARSHAASANVAMTTINMLHGFIITPL